MYLKTALRPKALVLLDGVVATGASDWYPLLDYADPSIHVEGIVAGDIIQVQVSNDAGIHEAISNVEQQGPNVTADGIYLIEPGARWARVNVTAWAGGGTITVTA